MRVWALRKDGRYWDGFFLPSADHYVGLDRAYITRFKEEAKEKCKKLCVVGLRPVEIRIIDVTKTSTHPRIKKKSVRK